MKILFILSILSSCFIRAVDNTDTIFQRVQAKYVSFEELLDIDFVEPFKDNIFALTFTEDTLPFIPGIDSLFRFDIGEGRFCMYYNNSLLRNTGYLIYGDSRKNEVHILNTGIIATMNVYNSNKYILVRIEEDADVFAFGAPLVKITKYLLFPPNNDSVKSLSILFHASTLLNSSKIELNDIFAFPNIYIYGTTDDSAINFVVRIAGDFVLPNDNKCGLWNNMKILERQLILSRAYGYNKKTYIRTSKAKHGDNAGAF